MVRIDYYNQCNYNIYFNVKYSLFFPIYKNLHVWHLMCVNIKYKEKNSI